MIDLSFLSEPKTFYRLNHTDKQPSASLLNVLAQQKNNSRQSIFLSYDNLWQNKSWLKKAVLIDSCEEQHA